MAELDSSLASESGSTGGGASPKRGELTPELALRSAWLWWVVLLLIPFVVFLWVVLALLASESGRNETLGNTFFMLSLLWLAVTVPGAFALRSYCFRAFWAGRPVEPRSYLRGMITVWLSMEIGGLVALAGCWLSNSLMPCLLPAAVAFMLFTPFWPSGNAMEETTGGEADEQLYHDPR
jgi:hypothetical protein